MNVVIYLKKETDPHNEGFYNSWWDGPVMAKELCGALKFTPLRAISFQKDLEDKGYNVKLLIVL